MIEPNSFIHGDCMDYLKDYPDKYFDLAIVDPPYGGVRQGGYMQGKGCEGLAKCINYNYALWSQGKPPKEYFAELMRVSKNQIIWGGNNFTSVLPEIQGWIAWDKKHPDGVRFADFEMAWTSFNMAARIFRFMWNGMIQENMGTEKEKRIHPTQKPVQLYKWLLSNFAKAGDKILDTHVGSASSLIACREMGFSYVGYEIDEDYYKAACGRLQGFTDQMNIFDFKEV